MGKRLPSPASLEYYGRSSAERIQRAKPTKRSAAPAAAAPAGTTGPLASNKEGASASNSAAGGLARAMDGGERLEERVPLKEVVADCVKRWFQDALKEARAGDTAMQVLVGQMYYNGYGVAKNDQKANAWISKASKYRSAVWKVSSKRPGYNASDSDSDEENDNLNSRSDTM